MPVPYRRLLAAGAVALFAIAAPALAQAQNVRVRGTVESLSGSVLIVKTPEGESRTVTLAPNVSVGAVVAATAADIKTGSYVGVGAKPQADGPLRAVQVFIFPEAMRGTAEGHGPWAVLPESTMTNATVADTVTSIDGARLTLAYRGGQQSVVIPPDANIIMAAPAEKTELATGAQVAMTASREANGGLTASRVTVARIGAKLPL